MFYVVASIAPRFLGLVLVLEWHSDCELRVDSIPEAVALDDVLKRSLGPYSGHFAGKAQRLSLIHI